MIESIDPTTLMKFCFDAATWAINQPGTLEQELDQCKHAIHTFCVNNDDPIYQGVDVLSESCICAIKEIILRAETQETPAEPETEPQEEVKEDGEGNKPIRDELHRTGRRNRKANTDVNDGSSESGSS